MKVRCPACNNEVLAANIDLATRIAKCSSCNNIFDCSNQFPASSSFGNDRGVVDKPKNFTLIPSPGSLLIVRRWFHPAVIALTFFCLFWNGFMVVWFYTAIKEKIFTMGLFGSVHGAVGLGVLYAVLAGYFNKTYFRIAYDSLTISHRPFPWAGQRTLAKGDLKQLYSKEVIHHGKHGVSRSYSVQVLTRDGKTIELVSGLLSSTEALFIEQEIEKYLKIEDVPVSGELPR
ncbi:MAG: hypothetical protein WCX16_06165 [Candidatus Omnitrophota bacterium]